jgi:hypothetical protein
MQQRRFPGSAGPHEENEIATIERQIDIVQDFWALAVLHGDLFKLQHGSNNVCSGERNDCEDRTLPHINPEGFQPLREQLSRGLP